MQTYKSAITENPLETRDDVAQSLFQLLMPCSDKFILGNMPMIVRGGADLVYKRIEAGLSGYMGRVFEEICKQYLWKQLMRGNMPIEFVSLGRWWGNDSKNKTQTEIDIMGEQDSSSAIFAECKWQNENVDLDILEMLLERSRLFSYTNVHYFVFSKTGFTKGCVKKADDMGNVTLVSYKDIVKLFASKGGQI